MNTSDMTDQFIIKTRPNYIPQGNEEAIFRAAFNSQIPMILKGPTGCGKTRFVEHMAWELDIPLVTVSCHEDLTAADLVGRFLLKNDETVWQDGSLTLAVRYGGICYLDEIVEARKDTTVIIHSLTDDRRLLYLDKTGEVIQAHPKFMMVLSYNPGYQSIIKDLKESTKQRFASIIFDHPSIETEAEIIASESGLDVEMSHRLAEMGQKIRELKGYSIEEGASSRLLVYVGRLMKEGLTPLEASNTAITQTLADETEIRESINNIVRLYFGDLMSEDTKENE